MSKGFLTPLWEKAADKMGAAAGMVPTALGFIKVKLAEGDAAGARARVHELREYHQAGLKFCDTADAALADNVLDGNELAALTHDLDVTADEAQDVFRGYDEDDAPTDQAPPAGDGRDINDPTDMGPG